MKAVFLDQDGALAEQPPGRHEPRHLTLRGGAGPALRLLARLDYRLFVIGSSDGASGLAPPAAMEKVGDRLADLLFRERLALDGFYYCRHTANVACGCRRPAPGLLLRAARDHGVDLRASWTVGAMLHDVEAGKRAGCRSLLIDNGREQAWQLGAHRLPTCMAPDLYAAALLIAAADGAPR